MMKNGIYDEELYTIDRIISFLTFLKSDIKIDPSKQISQIIMKGLFYDEYGDNEDDQEQMNEEDVQQDEDKDKLEMENMENKLPKEKFDNQLVDMGSQNEFKKESHQQEPKHLKNNSNNISKYVY